jgi:hypothetical protein
MGGAQAPLVVPVELTTCGLTYLIGLEGIAFGYENALVGLDTWETSIDEAITMLLARAWRIARIVAEMEYHMTDKPVAQIAQEYAARSGLSPKMAERDLRRALQEPGAFLFYYLGAAGVAQLGQFYEGGLLEALGDYQASCGGFVPPNWYAVSKGFLADARQFDFLRLADAGVQTTQRVYPPVPAS